MSGEGMSERQWEGSDENYERILICTNNIILCEFGARAIPVGGVSRRLRPRTHASQCRSVAHDSILSSTCLTRISEVGRGPERVRAPRQGPGR
jgi:hypothetical protein